MAILLYCPLHAITTLAAKNSQRRKKSTGRAQSLGWLCVYHRDIVSEQLEALARTNPPKKYIMDVRCHQMPSSVSIAKCGWNLEMDELIN